MKEFEIKTMDSEGSELTFLTKAKNIPGALRNLINRSADFTMVEDHEEITIKVKEVK